MPSVYSFGKGYYALDTDGVIVSPEVEERVKSAFERAKDKKIKVQLAYSRVKRASTKDVKLAFPTDQSKTTSSE